MINYACNKLRIKKNWEKELWSKRLCCDLLATDLNSSYPVIKTADVAGVPIQKMIMRNDIESSTTIGPIISTALWIATVDLV